MERLLYNIESFLRTGDGDFPRLALELFAYQFERNRAYRSYCQSREMTPGRVSDWQDIPAVPVQAFKSATLATFPPSQAAAIFESSGTTNQTPSRHYLRTLTYYELSLKASFSKWILNPSPLEGDHRSDASLDRWPNLEREHRLFGGADGGANTKHRPPTSILPLKGGGTIQFPFLILAPSPADAPHSSLSWMLDVVKRAFGAPGSVSVITRGRLDELWLATLLAKAQSANQPVALLGTTIAFLGFFDYAAKTRKAYRLASGSRLMDTGGLKTEKREISRAEFVHQAGEILGVPENACHNEYGMCELSSQFYGRGAPSYLEGPPWTRTLVIDLATGCPAPPGTPGLLRHFDLANVDSVLALQTEDMGIADGDGFIFLGRDPQAEVKGCSLSAEAFLT